MLRDFRSPLSPEVLAGIAVILDSGLQFWSLPTKAPSQSSVSVCNTEILFFAIIVP